MFLLRVENDEAAGLIDHKKLQEFLKNAEIKNFKNFSKAACKVQKT